ncbi:MAG: histidine kinase [Syntrophobacteraceae bacterium]
MNDTSKNQAGKASATRCGFFSSLRGRLLLPVLAVLVPVLLVQGASLYVRYRDLMKGATRETVQTSRAVAAAFEGFLAGLLPLEAAAGTSLAMPPRLSRQEMERMLKANAAGFAAVPPVTSAGDEAVTILDSRGATVWRFPGSGPSRSAHAGLKNLPAVKKALEGKESIGSIPSDHGEKESIAAFTPIPSIGWVACASRPADAVTASIESRVLREGLLFLLFTGALFLITGTLAVAFDVTGLRQAQQALQQSQTRLRSLSAQLLSAHEEERKRIARELHDSVGSSLALIKLGIESTQAELKRKGCCPGMLDSPVQWTQLTIDEIRRLMVDLRPPLLDDMGVLAALRWFFGQYRAVHPAIHVEARIEIEEQEIPESLRIVIFRIIQEAFHNIARHSSAEYVDFSLAKQEGTIKLRIEDNGVGFDAEAICGRQGLGLAGMKERSELSGGSFRIRSTPDTGTLLSAEWPVTIPARSG